MVPDFLFVHLTKNVHKLSLFILVLFLIPTLTFSQKIDLSVLGTYDSSLISDQQYSPISVFDTTPEIIPHSNNSLLIDSLETESFSTDSTVQNINSIVQTDSLGVFDMFTNLPGDWYRWSKQTFTTDNIPLIAALGVMTAGMVVTDFELWQPAKKLYSQSHITREISDAFVSVGDGKFQFGLAIGFGIYGVICSDSKALKTASQVTEVILACGGVVQLLKHLTGRESPFVATSRTGNWTLLPNQIEYHKHVPHYDAFPSGHIATAMATMIVISENYPNQKWIQYIGYPAVALVGVGLTTTSIHWVSDFPLGLALGYSFGMLIAHQFDNPPIPKATNLLLPTTGLTMLPNGTPALQLSWKW